MAKLGRAEETGNQMADALVEFIHMMYNKKTALRLINSLISLLIERKKEFI